MSSIEPDVAVRIVKNVIDKYRHDGLAFQRYLRKSQTGEGDDILSNMASPIVGLYRNIYGIQPKWNRLYLEPHLTPELGGTRLKYWLRNQVYLIDLEMDDYGITTGNFTVRDKKPFAIDVKQDTLSYFSGGRKTPSMTITRGLSQFSSDENGTVPFPKDKLLEMRIESWPAEKTAARKWSEHVLEGTVVRHVVADLPPKTNWQLLCNEKLVESLQSDDEGKIVFTQNGGYATWIVFELKPVPKH